MAKKDNRSTMMYQRDVRFKCPYCFKTVHPDRVAFRAESAFKRSEVPNGDALREKYITDRTKKDPLYAKFWAQYPGSEPASEDEGGTVPYCARRVIHNYWFDPSTGKLLDNAPMEYVRSPRDYERDGDGFVYCAYDDLGMKTEVRVCPHCNNVLPKDFGKYPVISLAVVGITSSGKTVYLSQLFNQIYNKSLLTRANFSIIDECADLKKFLKTNSVKEEKALPIGTVGEKWNPPVSVNVRNNDNGQRYTLVFYDIAGENCVDAAKMRKMGPFVENANGIILLLDPKQFTDLFSEAVNDRNSKGRDDDEYNPRTVLISMYNAFLARQAGGISNVPLAAVFSKSDLLAKCLDRNDKRLLGENSLIFHNTDYTQYISKGYPGADLIRIDRELMRVLGKDNGSIQGEDFCNTITSFPRHILLASSALGCETYSEETTVGGETRVVNKTTVNPDPIRIEDALFWILNQLNILPEATHKMAEPQGGSKGGFWPFGKK